MGKVTVRERNNRSVGLNAVLWSSRWASANPGKMSAYYVVKMVYP